MIVFFRQTCIAHSWCKVLSHRGRKGRLHTPATSDTIVPCSFYCWTLDWSFCYARFDVLAMKYSWHNTRIHTGSIHFGTHRYYSYFCSVWFALISTKFDRCHVRVSAVPLRVFAFRRSTDCNSCFVSFLHHSVFFSTLLTAITCLETTAAEYSQ